MSAYQFGNWVGAVFALEQIGFQQPQNKEGRHVVRLMAGDPVLDGAFARESAALTKAKIVFDFVPGVQIYLPKSSSLKAVLGV